MRGRAGSVPEISVRVTDAKIGPKVKMFVFRYVALFPKFGARTRTQDLWPFLISETGLKFLIWTQGKIHPGNRASPVNRAHMKRPSVQQEISVSGLEILPCEHFIPVTGVNGGMNSSGLDGIALHCLLYFPHHKHPI